MTRSKVAGADADCAVSACPDSLRGSAFAVDIIGGLAQFFKLSVDANYETPPP
jgi:hypothetical protein